MAEPDIQFETTGDGEMKALIAPMLSTVNDARGIRWYAVYVVTEPDGVIEMNTNMPGDLRASLLRQVMPGA